MPSIPFNTARRGVGSVLLAWLVVIVWLSQAPAAEASPPRAAIVVDVASGNVLYDIQADEPRYPASLTKMMTLYLLFEALQRDTLTLDDTMPVSRHAAAQEPSKLWVRPGEQLKVETAILALVVRSANDVAAVVAEGLAGSEKAFAIQMTDKARALGMPDTTFSNASGLPDDNQVTTARDMARLSLHLMQDFPEYYDYFARQKFTYKGKVHGGHNRLLTRYPGTDGLKTGYIHASGFNVATSAVHDGRRLVSVVMGGVSSRARDDRMIELLDRGFVRAALMDRGDWVAKAEIFPDESPVIAQATERSDPIGQLIANIDRQGLSHGTWAVQVGAFSNSRRARALASRAASYLSAADDTSPHVSVTTAEGDGTLYRARVVDMRETQARKSCRQLMQQGMECVVVAGVGG